MKKAKMVASLFGLSAILAAGTAMASLTWSNFVTLSGLDVESTGASGALIVWVGTTTTPTNKPSCGTSTAYELSGSADAVKALISAANSAYLAGKPVKLLWDGTCDSSYAKVVGISTN